jgi:SET domain-containing protein
MLSQQKKGLTIKKSEIPKANLGLFAVKNFKKEQIIDEYKGEIIKKNEETLDKNNNYIFSLNKTYHCKRAIQTLLSNSLRN